MLLNQDILRFGNNSYAKIIQQQLYVKQSI